ncbi:MAG: hypothetical protein HYY55_01785 [Candidatus Niyogibacteria bacterium]|nr:MAG: hypothetical protein HYY55_01785 [Candidatus Niyogibacteria bacterium]
MPISKSGLLVSLASGIFIGGALFDVLPETIKNLGISTAVFWLLVGYIGWWIIKLVLQKLKKASLPYLTAAALWLHSVLEGMVTGLAFGVSQLFGFVILIAMTLHILPEFFLSMILMKGAGSTTKWSLATTFAGFGLLYASFGITYWLIPDFGTILPIALALSGGAFLFVGLASFWKRKSLANFVSLLVGIGVIFLQSVAD